MSVLTDKRFLSDLWKDAIQGRVIAAQTVTPSDPYSMSLLDFARVAHVRRQATEYITSSTGFHRVLAEAIESAIMTPGSRLLISTPPQHGKTQLLRYSIALLFARYPSKKVVYASYGDTLAEETGYEVREIMVSDWYRAMFGDLLSTSRYRLDSWQTSRGGALRSVGIGSGLTGKPAEVAILDDPHKDRAEANSANQRLKVQQWYRSVFRTRWQGRSTSVIVIQTRWHQDDIIGWLLAQEETLGDYREGWRYLRIPALAEEDDPLGREVGESAYPERFSVSFLRSLRQDDPWEFEALYQARPVPVQGALFNPSDFVPYRNLDEVPPGYTITSWDTAMTANEMSALTSYTQFRIDDQGRVWVLDFDWRKLETPYIKPWIEKVHTLEQSWSGITSDLVLVEEKASGISIAQEFRMSRGNPFGVPVRAELPESGDKVLRSSKLQGRVVSHRVYVPQEHPRLAAWLAFFAEFPHGRYLDPVDSFTLGFNYAIRRRSQDKKTIRSRAYEH